MSYIAGIKPIRTDIDYEHALEQLDAIFDAEEGLTQKDLVPLIGSRSKVSEVLSRKRRFSLAMIRALHQELGIPV